MRLLKCPEHIRCTELVGFDCRVEAARVLSEDLEFASVGFERIIKLDLRKHPREGSRNLLCRGRNLDKEGLLIRLCI